MNIISVEPITPGNLEVLKKISRRNKREENERRSRTTFAEQLEIDLSWIMNHPNPKPPQENYPSELEPYEKSDKEGIGALLAFAEQAASSVLVHVRVDPSKAFVERLRWKAKQQGYKIRFDRLIHGYYSIGMSKLNQSDSAFPINLGIRT